MSICLQDQKLSPIPKVQGNGGEFSGTFDEKNMKFMLEVSWLKISRTHEGDPQALKSEIQDYQWESNLRDDWLGHRGMMVHFVTLKKG